MNKLPVLRTALLDLLWELQGSGINLIIGGGYGIFLKVEYTRKHDIRTLLSELPETRSTNDLDIFLRPELLIAPGKLKPLLVAIEKLGYLVVESAKNYQFIKKGPGRIGEIKIDILTGPQNLFEGTSVKTDNRRIRPSPAIGLHAHPVDEAPTLEDGLLPVNLSGFLSQGNDWGCKIYLPHPYTFLMMKLFAFRDRVKDEYKEFGRYHALDLYTIVATTSETEWDAFTVFHKRIPNDPYRKEASAIVKEYFSGMNSLGIIRLRESRYYRTEMQPDGFIDIIGETFQ
jgi:hypothetical protein